MGDRKLDFNKLRNIKKWLTPDKLITGILFGALLLVIAIPTGNGSRKKTEQSDKGQTGTNEGGAMSELTQSGEAAYVAELEEKLKTVLGKMSGIGRVEVMITLETTSEAVVNKDVPYTRNNVEETGGDQNRIEHSYESKEETVVVETDGDTVPYVIKSIYPKIQGVLVVAQGAKQAGVKSEIVEAIEVLFGVEPHKVKVLGMD